MNKPIQQALEKIPNRFELTTLIARRWESLVRGFPPLVDVRPGMSRIDVVLAEILADKLTIDRETYTIRLEGEPLVEEHDETLFNSAISPDANALDDLLGGRNPTGS